MDFYQILATIIAAFFTGMGSVIWTSYLNYNKKLQNLNTDMKNISISLNHTVESLHTINENMTKALTYIYTNNTDIAVLRSQIEHIQKQLDGKK